jgi:hypothetical protein
MIKQPQPLRPGCPGSPGCRCGLQVAAKPVPPVPPELQAWPETSEQPSVPSHLPEPLEQFSRGHQGLPEEVVGE